MCGWSYVSLSLSFFFSLSLSLSSLSNHLQCLMNRSVLQCRKFTFFIPDIRVIFFIHFAWNQCVEGPLSYVNIMEKRLLQHDALGVS